jgi:hypothetical protein
MRYQAGKGCDGKGEGKKIVARKVFGYAKYICDMEMTQDA